MAIPKEKLREIVFQLLFSGDFVPEGESANIPFMMKELSVTKRTVADCLARVAAIKENESQIDRAITDFSKEYAFDRIPRVEKNILRLAFYELFYEALLPPEVVISEAIRLARKFATKEAAGFVNAILDSYHKTKACT